MKVKAKVALFEGGKNYLPGDVFEVSEKRAKALGSSVEIIKESPKKEVKEAPKDKMIKEEKTK